MVGDYTELDEENYVDIKVQSGMYVDLYVAHKVQNDDGTSDFTVFQCWKCGTIYKESDTACMCCVDFSDDVELIEDWIVDIPDTNEEFEKIYGKW